VTPYENPLTKQKLIVKTCYPSYQTFLEDCEEIGLQALRAAVRLEEPKWETKNQEAEQTFNEQLATWSERASFSPMKSWLTLTEEQNPNVGRNTLEISWSLMI
jgi:hypothetical protein